MEKVRIVTDSVADLPPDVASALNIDVIPLNVQFGLETFRDQIDLTPDEFYQKLLQSRELPKTSQPPPGAFLEVYQRLLKEDVPVVSIHPTRKISGTYNSALIAWEALGSPEQIEVIDCRTGTAAQGLIALEAARAALRGMNRECVSGLVRRMADRVRLFVCLDTLDFLARNGRLGRARVFMASMLRIKPIITLIDGEIAPVDRVRGSGRVIPRLTELCAEFVRTTKAKAAVVHAQAANQARRLRSEMEQKLGITDILVSSMGPAVAANTGPGAIGVAVYEPNTA